MKIIDLSTSIYSGMKVYPGDPPVVFKRTSNISENGWQVTNISMGLHTGTHIDAPAHMIKTGKTLDKFDLSTFIGNAQCVFSKSDEISEEIVIPFNFKVTNGFVDRIIRCGVKIVGSAYGFTKWDIKHIRKLLNADILFISHLINTECLPKYFFIYCFPLHIKKKEASPSRVVAVYDG